MCSSLSLTTISGGDFPHHVQRSLPENTGLCCESQLSRGKLPSPYHPDSPSIQRFQIRATSEDCCVLSIKDTFSLPSLLLIFSLSLSSLSTSYLLSLSLLPLSFFTSLSLSSLSPPSLSLLGSRFPDPLLAGNADPHAANPRLSGHSRSGRHLWLHPLPRES